MKLYHASRSVHSVGEVIGPIVMDDARRTEIEKRPHFHVEELLEKVRPENKISRMVAIYAFSDPIHCEQFMMSEAGGDFFVYEIEAEPAASCPMAIVDVLCKPNFTTTAQELLISEYWEPKLQWSFIEHLCESIEILSVVQRQNLAGPAGWAANLAFGGDKTQAGRIAEQ